MIIQKDVHLAQFTSFNVGGSAQEYIKAENSTQLIEAIQTDKLEPNWLLGYGTNSLISDWGLEGLTMHIAGGDIQLEGTTIIADAGAKWDDIVDLAVENGLWGIELMKGIPGTVGAAVFINIAAYGQTLSNVVDWVELIDPKNQTIYKVKKKEVTWGYKDSVFQKPQFKGQIITRIALNLSEQKTSDLTYQRALDVAEELSLNPDNLTDRQEIILEARRQAGSLFEYGGGYEKTVGSFFRNPIVNQQTAERVIEFDETGKTRDQIKKMNQVHGGDSLRVSAAHVMLASGFNRGDKWGGVRLHPKNLLKIENAENASAQDIYNVAQNIIKTCEEKIGITLEPEVRILGRFS